MPDRTPLRDGLKGFLFMNSYKLSRAWFDFCFEHPEKIKPNHTALYFFCIEHCNRLGWKEKFGLPTTMAKEAIGIRSYNTFINTLNDLIEWKFIKMIEKSRNQYSSNIIALSNFNKALNNALDKALINHTSKQSESTSESIDSINKQQTNNQLNKEQRTKEFELFWNFYGKKVDRLKCEKKFKSLSQVDVNEILSTVKNYVQANSEKKFRKNPLTYLNGKCWQDEIIFSQNSQPNKPAFVKNR